ncbi:Cytochrome P450 2J2, partial [Stegodyphus mimosarum]
MVSVIILTFEACILFNYHMFIIHTLGFGGKNGVEWAEQRRASIKAMKNIGLGKTRWEELVQEEINELVNLIQQENGRALDVSEIFSSTFANNIMTLLFGNRLPLGHPATIAVSEYVDSVIRSFPSVSAAAVFPWLVKLFGKIGTYNDSIPLKKLSEFNQLITKMIMNRNEKESDDNFVDTYCNEMKLNIKSKMTTSFTETYLRGNTQTLLIGGSDTTRSSLTYLLMAVAQFPEIQNKVHEELNHVLGRDGCIKWAERSKVPYTYAVIMESMRWYTLVPVNTLRISVEDIKVQGYDIPKGTYILVNTWLLHNDPKYWPEPEKFIPERYLLNDGKQVNYKPESYSPFSYGKRSCPGEMVALVSLLHYFITIMQKFKVLPEGEKVEYGTILGLTCQPTDVKLRFIARE